MPNPYPIELRTRVMDSIESGMSPSDASKIFKVSPRAIHNWKKLKEQQGNLNPRPRDAIGKASVISAEQREEICKLVRSHPDLTLQEIKDITGVPITIQRISSILLESGFTYKKNAKTGGISTSRRTEKTR